MAERLSDTAALLFLLAWNLNVRFHIIIIHLHVRECVCVCVFPRFLFVKSSDISVVACFQAQTDFYFMTTQSSSHSLFEFSNNLIIRFI